MTHLFTLAVATVTGIGRGSVVQTWASVMDLNFEAYVSTRTLAHGRHGSPLTQSSLQKCFGAHTRAIQARHKCLGFRVSVKDDAFLLPPNRLGISLWYFHAKACRVTAVECFEDNDDDDYYSHPDAESDGPYISRSWSFTTHRGPCTLYTGILLCMPQLHVSFLVTLAFICVQPSFQVGLHHGWSGLL